MNIDTKPRRQTESSCEIDMLVDGSIVENEHGCCFVAKREFYGAYLHGGYKICEAVLRNPDAIGIIYPDACGLKARDLLFLDTETTGLAGGTGTVAFLIGAGYYTEDGFTVVQYFMRDYCEEPAVLHELSQLFGRFKALVTYNGKAFDSGILNSRYYMNRMKPPFEETVHIDLLYPSRVIWRSTLHDVRLSTIEKELLGEYRCDDIPGSLIPSAYMDYLNTRNAFTMKKVLEHNISDILSLTALLMRINDIAADPLSNCEGIGELAGAGRIFEKNREYDTVIECLEKIEFVDSKLLNDKAGTISKGKITESLSQAYKRTGRYKEACDYWELLSRRDSSIGIYPLIELAKYYEHSVKDYSKAIEAALAALQRLKAYGADASAQRHELDRRIARLKRKEQKSRA